MAAEVHLNPSFVSNLHRAALDPKTRHDLLFLKEGCRQINLQERTYTLHGAMHLLFGCISPESMR